MANPGDVVLVPEGACTWDTTVHLDKSVLLIGAVADATVINNAAGIAVSVDPTGDDFVRVSGFTFNNRDEYPLIIFVVGPALQVRLDHLVVNKGDAAIGSNFYGSVAEGSVSGVVDHNEFYNTGRMYHAMHIRNGESNWGEAAWAEFLADPASFRGSDKMLVFEDNQFVWDESLTNPFAQGGLYGGFGGKVTMRNNTFTGYCFFVDAHGDGGTILSTIYDELYGPSIPFLMSVYFTTDLPEHRVQETYYCANTMEWFERASGPGYAG